MLFKWQRGRLAALATGWARSSRDGPVDFAKGLCYIRHHTTREVLEMTDAGAEPVCLAHVLLLAALILAAVTRPAYGEGAGVPFESAIAVWHMGDGNDAAGKNSALAPHGEVTLGVGLSGAEYEASLQRGGDGKVGEFRGGYLSAGQGADGEANLSGRAMSLCLRVRLGAGMRDTPLFSKHGGHQALVYNLFCTDLGEGPAFGFELGTDAKEQPLCVSIPLSRVGAGDWHDVIVRFTGPKLELFVDGVLVDEEWPMGALRPGSDVPCLLGAESAAGSVKCGFHGWIDHAALWDRALTDAEIVYLSGGGEAIAARDRAILGAPTTTMQYWRPRGYNASVGDCMPFFHDGRFHLFYLFDRRHHRSKWGLGAHQWAHASTTDLVHWEQHPMAIPITEQWEGSICTGSVIFHEGTYYAHYAVRMPDGKQHLAQAISQDGIHFDKQGPFPLASPQEGYDPFHYRDPLVFEDTMEGVFRMLVTARLTDGRDGCLAQLSSTDLRSWTLRDPFLIPGRVTDCPDYFEWNGWHYLFAEFVYWVSRQPNGPWIAPESDRLDVLYVPKTAAFTGGRRIYVSWIPDGGWGGNAVFRELIQHEDGALGTKFPAEMIPASGAPVEWKVAGASGGVAVHGKAIRCEAGGAVGVARLEDLPRNIRVGFRVNPESGAARFGVVTRGGKDFAHGCELRFEPPEKRAQFAFVEQGKTNEKAACAIEHVEGLGRPFSVDLIVQDDIIDVCVDDRRTMITRFKGEGSGLSFFAQDGRVTFEDIAIRPLVAP